MILKIDGRAKGANRGRYGDKSSAWKGKKASYKAQHKWINERYGKADRCESIDCLRISHTYEWANISGHYRRDIDDYIKLCRSCHQLFDRRKSTHCKRGHEFTVETTIIRPTRAGGGQRICRTCRNLLRRKSHDNQESIPTNQAPSLATEV